MLFLKSNKQKSFRYCLDTYLIRDPNCYGYSCSNAKNIIEKITIAKESGYQGVELWHKDVLNYKKEFGSLESLIDLIKYLNLEIVSYKVMQNFFDLEPFYLASELGSKSCIVKLLNDEYCGSKPNPNTVIKNYESLLKKSENLNIKPSIEFMSLAKYYNKIDDVCDIMEKIDHPNKSLVLDTWHLWRNGTRDFANVPFHRINPNWISVVHYTDAKKDIPREFQKDGDRKMPEEGVLDLNFFCNKLNSIDYNNWLSINVYDISLWKENPKKVALKGLQTMKRTAEIIN